MTRTALVTGASRGIGKAIALALAARGFDVALAARTVRATDPTWEHTQTIHKRDTRPLPGSLEETAAAVEAIGRRTLSLRMDLTDLDSVDSAMEQLKDSWGVTDVVVNNGRHIGPGLMDNIVDTPIDDYANFLTAHGIAPIRIAQLLLPSMLDRGSGTFVTITSGVVEVPHPSSPRPGLGYRIGKAAGHTLVGSIQAEYGDKGIRAFNVDPGFVLTERNSLDSDEFGFDMHLAAPASVVGEAVAWLVTSPEAAQLERQTVEAQPLAIERNLVPDWRY